MAENNQTNTAEIVRERANTSSKNTIVMLPDIIRAYHEIGLLSDGERDEVNGIKSAKAITKQTTSPNEFFEYFHLIFSIILFIYNSFINTHIL